MHVYEDVDCKETKETNKREKEKEGALRWNTCIIFTQPRNSALVTRSPELGKKSTKLSAYLRDIRASWVKNIENLLWKRIESSVRAFDLEWTLRECTYSRAIRNQTKKRAKISLLSSFTRKRRVCESWNASAKSGKNLNDANTYELSALQQAVGHEFPRS